MLDKRYPGFDVNPLVSIADFFQQETLNKLFEAGVGYVKELQSTPLAELRERAHLSDTECVEIEKILLMFSSQEERR